MREREKMTTSSSDAKKIDGKLIAAQVRERVKAGVAQLVAERGVTPGARRVWRASSRECARHRGGQRNGDQRWHRLSVAAAAAAAAAAARPLVNDDGAGDNVLRSQLEPRVARLPAVGVFTYQRQPSAY